MKRLVENPPSHDAIIYELLLAYNTPKATVDRLYRSKPFISDEERFEHLFKLYEEMTAKEQLV